jgi:probable phosphoglycerate mutase
VRLILVRHALPERIDAVTDAPDPDLSEVGERQVRAMTAALADERIDAAWSSPLRRAVRTAEPLAAARGLEIRLHPGLVEFDFGHGVYIPGEETDHPVVRKMNERLANQDGDAELLAFRDTVVAALADVTASAEPDATVAVACHGGVVNAYASAVVGARDVMIANIVYTGISVFTVSRSGRVRVSSLNEHQHLRMLARSD